MLAYAASYRAPRFAGSLAAYALEGDTGVAASTPSWDAAALLDARNVQDRFILGSSGTGSGAIGLPWKTLTQLPSAQQARLGQNSRGVNDDKGQQRLDYLRGERSLELFRGGDFRDRDSRLGDIVNSRLWYTGRPASSYSAQNYATFRSLQGKGRRTPMLYVGANDGMLHGFNAQDGSELLAYIPQGIALGDLRRLSDSGYAHQYFVDGSPLTGDAWVGTAWKTILVGTLGAGGKGYFVLDVSDPADFNASQAQRLVLTDTTAMQDADIGHITAAPVVDDAIANQSRQIVQMNNGRWAAVLGNGYNSANEAPVLLIQYLDGARELFKLSPCGMPVSAACNAAFKGDNGLSAPRLIDLNGDNTVDLAYAGDLRGNLWKFDLSAASESGWKVAFDNQPFFLAGQAITSAPYAARHPLGGIMVALATGRNLTDADSSDSATQSVYALWDDSAISASSRLVSLKDGKTINSVAKPALPASLVEQTASASPDGPYYSSSNRAVSYPAQRGWFLRWPEPGQRVLHHIAGFAGEKILVPSLIPAPALRPTSPACDAAPQAQRNFLSVFNLFSGAPPQTALFSGAAADWSTLEIPFGEPLVLRHKNKVLLLSPNGVCPGANSCSRALHTGSYLGLRAGQRRIP